MGRVLSAVVILLSLAGCIEQKSSFFGVDKLSGTLLAGKRVDFKSLPNKRLILNVYSPTCAPCIQEIPALNILYKKAAKAGTAMYIIVEQNPEKHGFAAGADPSTLTERLQADIEKYKIEIPVVVMDSNFVVSNKNGLVTATPETLFFKMDPMNLEYNFIGPVSTLHDPKDLARDSRFQFVLSKI